MDEHSGAREYLREQAAALPTAPGVYMFRDGQGIVLYVGKARSLRDRVRSYFSSPSSLNTRTLKMLEEAREIDFLVTDSEVEALIFESDLIKRHRPRYNVRLRDDKQYPYIVVTTDDEFPRVGVERRMESDAHRYFGPFTNTALLRRALEQLRKVFPYRTCSDYHMQNRDRPCLHYHVGRCLAPCSGEVSAAQYADVIDGLLGFLGGRSRALTGDLRDRMRRAADSLEFERAARIRDQIEALKAFREQQGNLAAPSAEDIDVVGMARRDHMLAVALVFMREGRVVGSDGFVLSVEPDRDPGDVLSETLREYYSHALLIPRRVLVPTDPDDRESLQAWLSEARGSRVIIHRPQRGEKRRMVSTANKNAELQLRAEENTEDIEAVLEALRRTLDLPAPPRRIECFDISSISGSSAVGSMVVFERGRPVPYAYRRFRIRTVDSVDDYAMMREVLTRRAKYVRPDREEGQVADDGSFSARPDLIVIDGGVGHVSAAGAALAETPLCDVPLVGIAKREERIYVPGSATPIPFEPDDGALRLLQRVRDEAHRFALDYHRQLRSRGGIRSVLDDIPGIGPRRRNALLAHFESVVAIASASEEQLASVPGMNRRAARAVRRYLLERVER